jgi:hypothetical protein
MNVTAAHGWIEWKVLFCFIVRALLKIQHDCSHKCFARFQAGEARDADEIAHEKHRTHQNHESDEDLGENNSGEYGRRDDAGSSGIEKIISHFSYVACFLQVEGVINNRHHSQPTKSITGGSIDRTKAQSQDDDESQFFCRIHVIYDNTLTLKVFVESPRDRDKVHPIDRMFSLVDSSEDADLVVRRTDDNTLQFERLDLLMSKYMQVLSDIRPEQSLLDILQGVSRFNHHLSQRNRANPLKQYVKVDLNSLTQSNPDMASEEAIYMPDGKISLTLASDHENTVFISNEAITYYGLTVTNESGRNLFPYLIYFDPSDYSVKVRCL